MNAFTYFVTYFACFLIGYTGACFLFDCSLDPFLVAVGAILVLCISYRDSSEDESFDD